MADEEKVEHESGGSKNPLAKLSTKQKVIGLGVIAAVGFGILSARNRGNGAEPVQPKYEIDEDTLYVPPNTKPGPGSGGGPIPAPGGGTTPTPGGGYIPNIPKSTGSVIPGVESGPRLGYGGIDYNTATPEQKTQIIANENRLASDSSHVLSELKRTESVIANREKAGLDTSAQVEYQDKLHEQAAKNVIAGSGAVTKVETTSGKMTAASTTSSVSNPGYGIGGGDYNKVSTSAQASMAASDAKISSGNQSYISSELARTAAVIANRKAAGLDISDQLEYQSKLQAGAR